MLRQCILIGNGYDLPAITKETVFGQLFYNIDTKEVFMFDGDYFRPIGTSDDGEPPIYVSHLKPAFKPKHHSGIY